MSTPDANASATGEQAKTRTKKKTLGGARKTKGASMVDIVSAAPTGTGYLETNPFQGAQSENGTPASTADETGPQHEPALNSETGGTAPAETIESSPTAARAAEDTAATSTAEDTTRSDDTASEAVNSDKAAASASTAEQVEDSPRRPQVEKTPAATDNSPASSAATAEPDTGRAAPSSAENAPRVSSWTIHAKNARAALLGVAKALDKVDARAKDVHEVLRSAGPAALPEQDLVAIVHEVASRSGHPVYELVRVANLDLPVEDSQE